MDQKHTNKPSSSENPSPQRIRVLIADDQVLMRTGLTYCLLAYDELEMVGEAGSGEEAVAVCAQTRPDVILMDLLMPGITGAEATRRICERWPQVKVIILTNFLETELVQEALQAGAIGYLLKNVSADDLANAIRLAHTGQPTLAPEATLALVQATANPTSPGHDLTPREREVLAGMVEGLSNQDIAERLTIGLSTVKFHASSIFSKLNVNSRAEAVTLAWQHNLVSGLGKKPNF